MLVSCAAHPKTRLIDPFPLRFPLVEAGTLEIDGHIAGQPRARDGIVYYATREGYLTAVVIRSRSILWRRPVDGADPDSIAQAGSPVDAAAPALKIEGPRLQAIDGTDRILWEFAAEGTISVEPVTRDGRVYFGDSDRMFYCLDAATGKVRWRRRLQGAALHPAVIRGGTIAVAASNSVVYFLSRKGGSILSWEAIPSRVVYDLAAAGSLVLISSASPTVVALDLGTGKRSGQYAAPGPLVAGAAWSPPYIVLFVEDEASGRQKIIFLRSR
ncbi:MAG: PQQ-binding-like beta-propeller repeat protein [Candidatus Aminicenantales bacterium]